MTVRASDLITIREASERTGIKIRTIRSWIEKNAISHFKDVKTGRVFIPISEIDRMEGKAMAVRNFYFKANVDGYKTKLKGGPRRKDGWMEIEILQRNKGKKETVFTISCSEVDGKLYTEIIDGEENTVAVYETER